SSTCGVKVGLCLPRRRLATMEARRPTTRPSALITTHFFTTSAGFCEKVAMVLLSAGPCAGGAARRFLLLGLTELLPPIMKRQPGRLLSGAAYIRAGARQSSRSTLQKS